MLKAVLYVKKNIDANKFFKLKVFSRSMTLDIDLKRQWLLRDQILKISYKCRDGKAYYIINTEFGISLSPRGTLYLI